ncbi:TRAP transporter small permease subunit [Pikeienuella piscinae]|uniref:TRAP transporter small permease protein n=1 Tax=Pikeienuella piscinae TaxID=2748098 RepID=A0A7L5C1U5_9RHOB|nr:TRAP transporter small permease subunit [Pikeienuella piscinae]QIE56787.1 TRAP transporter small permease subunit [Pikeienuella piscinae]
MKLLRDALEWLLEWATILLMVGLTLIVVVAVIFRLLGQSFSWYDEVAVVGLAWITYYGAALAALKRRHIGFDSVLLSLPTGFRLAAAVFAEAVTLAFFALLAWAGMRVLQVLAGDTLVSLDWVPVQLTQSVIPIGAGLFIVAQLLSMPGYLRAVRAGVSLEHAEIDEPVR